MSYKLYYYTDFNTFKLILKNGTLRFKESTSSNDNSDTVQLYTHLLQMAEQRYEESGISPEQKFYFDMVRHIGATPSRFSLVACFTNKEDSRLLWDAYTMHRKDRTAERYNGVCIEFNKDLLVAAMDDAKDVFDIRRCSDIIYGFDQINRHLEELLDIFSKEVIALSRDENQDQNIVPPIKVPFTKTELRFKKCLVYPILHLMDKFDVTAPYYKHSFWHEECETRALLSLKCQSSKTKALGEYDNGSKYFDLKIFSKCINKVILGPEMSNFDVEELESIKGRILFSDLKTVPSAGTNIITNR